MGIRWVILSDLHLGADQSVLTAVDGTTPSATARALADCLRVLAGDDRPTLVLAGDAIELALTEMDTSFRAFEEFLELVHGDEPFMADRIVYTPGNHDHHLWQFSRQQGYMRAITHTPVDEALPKMWFTSGLDPDADLPLSPLVSLMRRNSRWDGVYIDAVYPNLALRVPGVDRSVIVHHGHYTEPIYRAMSRLGSLVFPADPPSTVEQIELENNAWIDFLWSELGRSGGVGTDLKTAYHLLPDASSVRHITDGVADRLADRWTRWPIPSKLRRWLVRTVVGDVVATARALETQHGGGALSPSAEAGLIEYLCGPLARQLDDAEHDYAFVFGHTHKPFQQLKEIEPTRHVPVYNTGGWVNETAEIQRTQGAQAILVDDELNVVAVELFRQSPDPTRYRVRVREPLIDDDGHRRFHSLIDDRVRPTESPWTDFSTNVAAELADCRARLATLYATYR
jgi:UDP-2,3-diacylglucosamine pyrophosphatase LpxH